MVLAWLVVLSAAVLTLEIQRHVQLARILGTLVMLAGWRSLLSSELQLRAVCCAVVYHALAEGCRPCVLGHYKDRNVVLWLVFWARVYTWGATLGGVAQLSAATGNQHAPKPLLSLWPQAAVVAFYHEVLEGLVLLYLTDLKLSSLWHTRCGHWLVAVLVGALERSGRLNAILQRPLLARMSPVALVGVLLLVMWFSIAIQWARIVQASRRAVTEDDKDENRAKPSSDHAPL